MAMMAEAKPTSRRRGVSDERLVELVDSRRQHSLRYSHKARSRLSSRYDTYRGVWQGRLSQFRNNVSLPFIFSMIQSDVARKVQTSLGGWPIVGFSGYSPQDALSAKKNEILVSAQMKDANSLVKGVDFFLQADLYGVAVARYGWKNVTRKNRVRVREQMAPGFEINVEHEYDAVQFDGPNWEVVDPLDFWEQPGKKCIEDMHWVIHRYWQDLDDMKEDALAEYPYFDKAAVNLLAQTPLSGYGSDDYNARQGSFRNRQDYEARSSERFAKPVEIWEMQGIVPDEMAPDGIRTRCIAIGNGRVVLKNRPLPYWDQEKCFLAYSPMPDPHSFWATGKVEIAEKMQSAANRIANQKLDALDLLIDPQIVVSSNANLNVQNLFARAGKVILVDGPADETNIRALQMNMSGLQGAYQEINSLWEFMQLGTGVNDIVQGTSTGDRETARGFMGRQENVMTRLMLEARLAEEGFIEPLGDRFRNLDRQFLTLPHEQKILGSVSTINPVTGLPYPQEDQSIDFEDLHPNYRARAVGATQMIGKSNRQQSWISLIQMMTANPAMMQIVNWANVARESFMLFDFNDVEDFLVSQVPMVSQQAQEMGMDPAQLASTVSNQSLPQLNPELLTMLGNHQPQGQMGELAGAA